MIKVGDITLEQTEKSHYPALYWILKEWDEYFCEMGSPTYNEFFNILHRINKDSLTAIDESGRILGFCYIDNIHEDFWASIHAMKQKGVNYKTILPLIKPCLTYFFTVHNLNKLIAYPLVKNKAAIKLIETAGFFYEGVFRHIRKIGDTWHDAAVYSLLREEI